MDKAKTSVKLIRWSGLFTAALVAACAIWWFQVGKQEAWAKRAVQAQLNDPDSALFRNVHVVSNRTACGEVNAKNLMGGYTGYRRFVAIDGLRVGAEAWIEPIHRESSEEKQVAVSLGQEGAQPRSVAREVFSALSDKCVWN